MTLASAVSEITQGEPDRTSTWDNSGDSAAPNAAASVPRLVLAMECSRLTVPGCRLRLDDLDEIIVGRASEGAERTIRQGRSLTLQVHDFETSRRHLAIRRRPMGWEVEDLGSRNGTLVNGERVAAAMLAEGDLIEAGGAFLVFFETGTRAADGGSRDLARRGAAAVPVVPALQTLNLELDARIAQVRKIAPSIVPVLVRGETGTGKELMARAIHEASGRPGAFVAVNCGALPRDLIEAELFGHRRGAFTGAGEDREGLVRRAHRGTLFLDEIAELSLDSQVALLRMLQESEVRPVGASEPVKVDVRIVVATHQDLEQRIAQNLFRQDLYARIAGFEVTMPPLRDRREDLGALVASLLARAVAAPERVTIQKAAARALFRYPWPLNIRELAQTLSAATALSDGGQIRIEHLPPMIREHEQPKTPVMTPRDRLLRERLVQLLREHNGNIAAVGRAMERAPIQIRRWCHRLRIDLRQFRH